MTLSPRSALLEIVWPKGRCRKRGGSTRRVAHWVLKATVFDHEIITRTLGHKVRFPIGMEWRLSHPSFEKHYAVWNDTVVTYMNGTNFKVRIMI